MGTLITAAGGVVFRIRGSRREVLVIHRPRYDDWSFPKGKHDDGETDERAALREIEEETGVRGRIIGGLGEIEYETPAGNDKQVVYFAVRAVDAPEFEPNDEVDRIEWLPKKKARERLTYDHDRTLLAGASLKQLAGAGEVHLVRHAAAGSRSKWEGPDLERPLTATGRRQARALADRLGPRVPDRLLSSPYVRCVQTVEPLGDRLGLDVQHAAFLEEGSDGDGMLDFVAELPGAELVMVSHGDVIPEIIDRLRDRGVPLTSNDPKGRLDYKKGSDWILTTRHGRVTAATYEPPPKT